MRFPPIAALVALSFALGFVPLPAIGAALPQLGLACAPVAAGEAEPCTITRLSGGQGIYVLFRTSDGTAKAGVDYTPTQQMIYLKGGVTTATVKVPTIVNPAATGTLNFNAAVTAGTVAVRASGAIVEPAPPPAPPPAPVPTGGWVPADLTTGGYAFLRNQGPCCNGLIVRLLQPNQDGTMWLVIFYSDTSGNFPVDDQYEVTLEDWQNPDNLEGLAPAS